MLRNQKRTPRRNKTNKTRTIICSGFVIELDEKEVMKIDPLDITIDNIKNGLFEKELPEFYELKDIFENNPWHHESTFEHTLNAISELEHFLKSNELPNEKVFRVMLLLHDISKKETKTINEEGLTYFIGHEQQGAKKAKLLIDRFNFSDSEKDYVISLIENHDRPHTLFDDMDNVNQAASLLKQEFPEMYNELLVFGMLDTMSSILKDNRPDEYKFRIGKYRELLNLK